MALVNTTLYKTFQRVRQSLPLLFALLVFEGFQAANAQGAPSPYTVQNINVDVSADNALKAREQAFEQAQVKAFEELATRMMEGEALNSFTAPPAMTISTMIQDYEVTDEKLASKRYSGTYTFRFKQGAVQKYFNRAMPTVADAGTGTVTASSATTNYQTDPGVPDGRGYLVLPFLDNNGAITIWSPQNLWLRGWSSIGSGDGAVPVVAPLGDLDDVRGIGDNEALNVPAHKLNAMVTRYGAIEAVIAIAKKIPTGGVTVDLYRTDSSAPRFVRQIMVQPVTGDEALYASAAREVRQLLQSDWKRVAPAYAQNPDAPAIANRTPMPAGMNAGVFPVHARFGSLQEWSQIQRALAKTYGLKDVALKALSPREAYIELSFAGDMAGLQLALGQSGLTLSAPQAQNVSLSGGAASYELSLRGAASNSGSHTANPNAPYQGRF
jgi:hypothetical protein